MSAVTARLTIITTIALTAIAQVVVAPAACCLLSDALFQGQPCCESPQDAAVSRSCCLRFAETSENSAGREQSPQETPTDCPWCHAGPKISVVDRVEPPANDASGVPAVNGPAAMVEASPVSVDTSILSEPFHRSAPAICAWLCVWRK